MSIKYFWTVTPLNPALKILIIIRNPEKQAVKWTFFISYYPEDSRYFSIHSVQKKVCWRLYDACHAVPMEICPCIDIVAL